MNCIRRCWPATRSVKEAGSRPIAWTSAIDFLLSEAGITPPSNLNMLPYDEVVKRSGAIG